MNLFNGWKDACNLLLFLLNPTFQRCFLQEVTYFLAVLLRKVSMSVWLSEEQPTMNTSKDIEELPQRLCDVYKAEEISDVFPSSFFFFSETGNVFPKSSCVESS